MSLAIKHRKNQMVPGTMRVWLNVVGELETMVADFTGSHHDKHQEIQAHEKEMGPHQGAPSCNEAVTQQLPQSPAPEQQRQADAHHPSDRDQRNAIWTLTQEDLGFRNAQPDPAMPDLLSLVETSFNPMVTHGAEPSEAQFWQELHWEGISDMILGFEARSRTW
jgi:hypothetical protein